MTAVEKDDGRSVRFTKCTECAGKGKVQLTGYEHLSCPACGGTGENAILGLPRSPNAQDDENEPLLAELQMLALLEGLGSSDDHRDVRVFFVKAGCSEEAARKFDAALSMHRFVPKDVLEKYDSAPYDVQLKALTSRLDWRLKWRFGFYHYGCWRYLRIGKLGIQLWRIS